MNISLRPAVINDLRDLWKIEQTTFNQEKYHLVSQKQYRYLLEKANAEIWIAEHSGSLYGSSIVLFRRNSNYGRFYSIAVLPDQQGGQIGKMLFNKAEERIKERNLSGLLLEVRSDNVRLLERYQRLGYKAYKEVQDYYPDHMSCIKMKKNF